jgi:lipopolysaccharide exporter
MSIFKKYSYWIHSGKYTAIQKFSVLGMGIVSFMLLTRVLGPDGFGVWGLFMVISSLTETARTALIKNAFIRFMHQTKEEEHGRLQVAALVISSCISATIAILFVAMSRLIAGWLSAPLLAGMLQWYAVSLMISVLFAHCEMLLNARMDFKGVCWMYCVRQGFLLAGIAFCVLSGSPITPWMLSIFYLLSVMAGVITGLFFSRPYLKWDIRGYGTWASQIWKFGRYVFGNNVCTLLFRGTDNFITSSVFGPGVSAYYNACLRIGNLVDMPSQVLGDVLFPKAAKYNGVDRHAIKGMYEKTVGAILIFSIPALLVLILFPSMILHFLAGGKFMMAASVLRITAFFGFTLPFLKQFGTIMDATGDPITNFKVMFVAMCINVVANLAGIHYFGVIGAAIGTATTYFILFVITQIILHRRFGVQWLNVFKNCFLLYKEIFSHGRDYVKLKAKIYE